MCTRAATPKRHPPHGACAQHPCTTLCSSTCMHLPPACRSSTSSAAPRAPGGARWHATCVKVSCCCWLLPSLLLMAMAVVLVLLQIAHAGERRARKLHMVHARLCDASFAAATACAQRSACSSTTPRSSRPSTPAQDACAQCARRAGCRSASTAWETRRLWARLRARLRAPRRDVAHSVWRVARDANLRAAAALAGPWGRVAVAREPAPRSACGCAARADRAPCPVCTVPAIVPPQPGRRWLWGPPTGRCPPASACTRPPHIQLPAARFGPFKREIS